MQAEIARLMEEARATTKFHQDYQEELKQATKESANNGKDTVQTVTQMHEMLIAELRKVNLPLCSFLYISIPFLCISACFYFDDVSLDVSGKRATFKYCVKHSKSR